MSLSHKNGIALTGLSAIDGLTSISALNGIAATLGASGPAFVGSVSGESTNNTSITTSALNTSSANLIVVGVSFSSYTGDTFGITDSYGNTWTALTANCSGGAGYTTSKLFYCYNPTVGAVHTFSWSRASTYPSIFVLAFSGAAASPFDAQTVAGNGGPITTLAAGSITPSTTKSILVTMVNPGAAPSAIDSGYTLQETKNGVANNSYGGGIAYFIASSISAHNPTWTFGASEAAASHAAFKA